MSRYAEIVVKITPARSPSREEATVERSGSNRESKRAYDALIYTNLPFFGSPASDKTPPGQPDAIAGMPLVTIERIKVRWSRYQEYLAAFVEGEKAPVLMREQLLEAMSPRLEAFFSSPPATSQPIRLWWSSDTPELEDLPWELLTYRGPTYPPEVLSFVRGLPPETPAPIIPVEGRLRLAFIHNPSYTPPALSLALHSLTDLEVIDMGMSPHKALREAAVEGYELIHIVSDAIVSSAYEGILCYHTTGAESVEISPGELSALMRSSRGSVLSLTAEEYTSPDTMDIAGWHVPSAYRGFAYLGSSRLSMPSVVTQLGPLRPDLLEKFWSGFYKSLAETLNLRKAMASGLDGSPPMPIALFLRHRQEVIFRRVSHADKSTVADPARLGAALQLSQELVDQLQAHQEQYGSLPDSVNRFIASESVRQENISSELNPWLTPDDEEASHE